MVKRPQRFGGEWQTAALSAIASIRDSRIDPAAAEGGTLCVELEHIGQGNGRLTGSSTAERVSTKYRFEVGDILFGRLRPYLQKWWCADRPGVCSTEIWPLVPDPSRADSRFLYALVQAGRLTDAANVSYGTHMPRADWSVVAEVEIPVPPLPEQRAIATVLMDVDALIGSLEALIAKKRAIKQAAMQQLLTGRTRLPGFRGDWKVRRLRSDVSLLSGHHVMARDSNVLGVGIPYLTGPADFPRGYIRHTRFTTKPMTVCQAGDILVTVKGSGSGTLVEADAEYCISRQLMAIRPTRWNPTFLRFSLLQNASRIKAASTGLIPGLSRSDILDQALPIPSSEEEQRAIAAVLSDMDAELTALERRLDKTRAVKQGTMQQLLTGSIRLPIPDAVAENGPGQ